MGKGSNTTTTQSGPPPQVLANYQDLVSQAKAVTDSPYYTSPLQQAAVNQGHASYDYVPGDQYAAQTDYGATQAPINTAIGNLGTAANTLGQAANYIPGAQPYYRAANNQVNESVAHQITPTQFSGNAVGQYESPYTQDVVNATQAQFNNANAQQSQSLLGQGIKLGNAFGGDRAGVAQAALAGQQQMAQAPVIAGLENQGYSQALTEFNNQQQTDLTAQQANVAAHQQAANLYGGVGNNTANLGTSLGNIGLGYGATAQGDLSAAGSQAALANQYQNLAQQGIQNETQLGSLDQSLQMPKYSQVSWLAPIVEGTGALAGGTSSTTSPGPSAGSQLAGLGTFATGAAAVLPFLKTGGRVETSSGGKPNTIAETKQTLEIQQRHLKSGHRHVQMFPNGESELSLPKGADRITTPNGDVFHYNPAHVKPQHILEASAKGRENELLGLGPFNKQDVIAHSQRTGEPIFAVVERSPEGTEVRATAATHSTAPHQLAHFEKTKYPGHRVGAENIHHTLFQRMNSEQPAGLPAANHFGPGGMVEPNAGVGTFLGGGLNLPAVGGGVAGAFNPAALGGAGAGLGGAKGPPPAPQPPKQEDNSIKDFAAAAKEFRNQQRDKQKETSSPDADHGASSIDSQSPIGPPIPDDLGSPPVDLPAVDVPTLGGWAAGGLVPQHLEAGGDPQAGLAPPDDAPVELPPIINADEPHKDDLGSPATLAALPPPNAPVSIAPPAPAPSAPPVAALPPANIAPQAAPSLSAPVNIPPVAPIGSATPAMTLGEPHSYGDIIAQGVASVETPNKKQPYLAVGPRVTYQNGSTDYAYGKYQVMGVNIPKWTKDILGVSMTPEQFLRDPHAQDVVAKTKLGEYYAKTGSVPDAASMWFTGVPLAQGRNRTDAQPARDGQPGYKGMRDQQYADRVAAFVANPTGAGNQKPVYVSENNLDKKPVVDHSGDTVKVNYSDGKSIDLGLPSKSKWEQFGDKFGVPLMAAGLGMMASKSPFPGVAIGEGGLAGIQAYREQQNQARQQSLAEAQIGHLGAQTGLVGVQTEAAKDELAATRKFRNTPVPSLFGGDTGSQTTPAATPVPPLASAKSGITAVTGPAVAASGAAATAAPAITFDAVAGSSNPEKTLQTVAQAAQTVVGVQNTPSGPVGVNAFGKPIINPNDLLRLGDHYAKSGLKQYQTLGEQYLKIYDTMLSKGVATDRQGNVVPIPGAAETAAFAAGTKQAAESNAKLVDQGLTRNPDGSISPVPGYNPAIAATAGAKATAEVGAKMEGEGLRRNPDGTISPVPGYNAAVAGIAGDKTAAEAKAKAAWSYKEVQPVPGGPTYLVSEADIASGRLPPGAVIIGPGVGSPPGEAFNAAISQAPAVVKEQPAVFAERQKAIAKDYETMGQQFRARQSARERLQEIQELLTTYQPGKFAEQKANMIASLRSVGINVANSDTANPEAFERFIKNATRNVFDDVKSMGGRVLVSEIQGLTKANANPELQPGAARSIVGQGIGLIDYEDKHYNDFAKWYKSNPYSYDTQEFEIPWSKENPVRPFAQDAQNATAVKGEVIPPAKDRIINRVYISPTTGKRGRWNGTGFVEVE